MKTLAFYSYKGGVGRSLLLANAARFLATSGNGVVALDLDLEAPGLHYKLFGTESSALDRLTNTGGAVQYLLSTAQGAESAPPLDTHTIDISVPPETGGWLKLMPAGPAPRRAYWEALQRLGVALRFSDPSGRGMMALLDLHARIEQELEPDYLLIDSRAGVTELGGLVTTMLADTVVCLFAADQESLDGTLAIVEALKAAPRLKGRGPIDIVPILSGAIDPAHLQDSSLAGFEKLRQENWVHILPSRTHDDHLQLLGKLFPLPARSVRARP